MSNYKNTYFNKQFYNKKFIFNHLEWDAVILITAQKYFVNCILIS